MIALVKANYNTVVTDALLDGCTQALREQHAAYRVWTVPGAVEIVSFTKKLLSDRSYTAIIVIGAVIKGDTDHYEYVCDFVTNGISMLSTQAEIPIVFGILTTKSEEQALERALPDRMNKGREFADTAIRMIALFNDL
jgi:6,7-dimethyl-8-ribityllumazine synthase